MTVLRGVPMLSAISLSAVSTSARYTAMPNAFGRACRAAWTAESGRGQAIASRPNMTARHVRWGAHQLSVLDVTGAMSRRPVEPTKREAGRIALGELICCFFDRSGKTYGSPRITLDLSEEGWQVSQNTLRRAHGRVRPAGVQTAVPAPLAAPPRQTENRHRAELLAMQRAQPSTIRNLR